MKKAISQRVTRNRPFLLCVMLCLPVVTARVLGCGWAGTDHSVRFNAYRTSKEFGRLPPLLRCASDEATRPFIGYEGEYEQEERRIRDIDILWDQALKAQERNDLEAVRDLLRRYLESTYCPDCFDGQAPESVQKRRNSAIDRLDALTALDSGSPASGVKSYLDARSAYDSGKRAEEVTAALESARRDSRLADNLLYLEAALLYRDGRDNASEGFRQIAIRYPQSEKREAALFMAAVAEMKQSKSYENARKHGASAASCDDCRDEAWQLSRAGFERVMREYPRGRYIVAAQGWLAYLSVGAGDRVDALVRYYRMLSRENDPQARVEALTSLTLVRPHAGEAEMARVEARLEAEPAVALVYAYHNIYNYAVVPIYELTYDDTPGGEDRAELERAAAFSKRLMKRYPSMEMGGGFALRLAEANLELDHAKEAADLARRAHSSGLKGDDRAQALWIEGVAEYRLGHYGQARQVLSRLIAEYPKGRLMEGARRNLAMLAEDMGDLDAALEQYLALDYNLDVAYFTDVLMTPEQLAHFIENHPSLAERDELLYGLGVRYLREWRWQDARRTLGQVRVVGRGVDDEYKQRWAGEYYGSNDNGWIDTPKELSCAPGVRGIRPQWIEQDLKTADDLERLEREANLAEGDEAKAEALYQMASYIYERSLLFYNPAAWEGVRHYYLYDLDSEGRFRRPNEAHLLFQYMNEHDMAARSLVIYLDVAKRFPATRAARDALYTAAVCHERLSGYNEYWRTIYIDGGYAGSRFVSYRDVKAVYGDYRFPRGTFGWEPSTRTVNGGPAWPPPPKAKPRPRRSERLYGILNIWVEHGLENMRLSGAWLARLYEVCRVGFAFSGLLFLWFQAAQARRVLRIELARCKPRTPVEVDRSRPKLERGWLVLKLDEHLSHETRDEWLAAIFNLSYKVKQLALDKTGRSALASNAATHGLFVALLMKLF